ncbi:MAG: flagellar biosynthesis protein FlhB [Desulfobulbia bacterium]
MAEGPEDYEKTEEPTQKKLQDAREKGDIAKSQEVNSWFIMFAATLFIFVFAGGSATSVSVVLKGILGNAHLIPTDANGLRIFFADLGSEVLAAFALPLILVVIAALVGNLVQHGFILSVDPIKPKLSKISPMSGVKRLFSATSLFNFLKSLLKLLIVSSVIAAIVWPNRESLDTIVSLDPSAILDFTKTMAAKVLLGVLMVLTLVAGLDLAFQKHVWWKKQRMSMKEIRDEYKQLEGDPMVRAKLRQVRIERGRKRMMAKVPEATVVITNPTHFSIALKFEAGMEAPVCLAKGVDNIAMKIREIAKENDIPLVENPPLARSLYSGVEIDEEIQPEHYKAVAEIIGYVMQLRQKN